MAKQVIDSDTTWGFYRLYNYSMSVSASTKVYGTYQFKKGAAIQAIRHMITPSVSFSYTPDFGKNGYGYYKQVQSDTMGRLMTYSPFANGLYGVPGSGPSMSLNFSVSQTLEMKVRDKKDTTGVRKIKLIDNLMISSSYNFLADSLNLSPFSLSLRTNLFKNVGLNVTATLDPYQVDPVTGRRINRFMLRQGKLGRLTSVQTSFGYSFNSPSSGNSQPAINDINSGTGLFRPSIRICSPNRLQTKSTPIRGGIYLACHAITTSTSRGISGSIIILAIRIRASAAALCRRFLTVA